MLHRRSWPVLLSFLAPAGVASADHHLHLGHHHHPHLEGGGGGGGGGYSYLGLPAYYPTVLYTPPPIFLLPSPAGPAIPPGPRLPVPEAPPQPSPDPPHPAARARKNEPAKAEHLIELGDHLFRVGNSSRATERYQQAAKADPASATPLVRLAQIYLARGKFVEAADAFRAAELVQPGWLAKARDIQALYAEPADFAKQVAKLESHLQAHPDDRDAWFVLGANWYLSGRVKKAADVFLRLADRQPDSALTAFLDAALPARPGAARQ